MRRFTVVLLLASLVTACGGDEGGDSPRSTTSATKVETTTSTAATSAVDVLGDNPSKEECFDVMRSVLERLEVPEGVDPSDGLDDEERAKADAAIEKLGEDLGLDASDSHPCNAATEDATDAEFEEVLEGLDPEVLELIGAGAQQTFEETGDAIN